MIHDLPQLFNTAKAEVMEALDKIDRLFLYFPPAVGDFFDQFGQNLGGYISSLVEKMATPTVTAAGNVAKSIPGALVNFVIVVLSSYFFIAERDRLMARVRSFTPRWIKEYMVFLRSDAKRLVGGYFLAQFRIMFVVAIVLAVGFFVLGVEYGVVFASHVWHRDGPGALGPGEAFVRRVCLCCRADSSLCADPGGAPGDPAQDCGRYHGASAYYYLIFALSWI